MRNIFLATALAAALLPLSAAANVPQEMFVSSQGDVHARGVTVLMIHALNLISVSVWKQKWMISTDYVTKFESSDGGAIKPEQIAVGHALEIKGRLDNSTDGTIDALLVRDLSIGTMPSGGSILDSICAAVTPQPSPVSSAVPTPKPTPMSALGLLAHTLALGAKGPEVSVLQTFLQKKAFGIPDDGPVTGYFGKVTEDAVKKFQQANNLEATGTTGPKTRMLINAILGTKAN